jgi:hypothetical protein
MDYLRFTYNLEGNQSFNFTNKVRNSLHNDVLQISVHSISPSMFSLVECVAFVFLTWVIMKQADPSVPSELRKAEANSSIFVHC